MTPLTDARSHLKKAEEFLSAAQSNLDRGFMNAATSNAVSCAINAKDAICLKLTGRTEKSDGHIEAVAQLKRAGGAANEIAPTIARLLRLKSKSQYQAASISGTDAAKAVEWALRSYEVARTVLAT